MKLIDIINQHYISSCSITPQYTAAKRAFKRELGKIFGKDNVIMNSCPHFKFTGFIRFRDEYVYFSSSDLRWKSSMLVRKADHPKDYKGKANNFVSYTSDFDEKFILKVYELFGVSREDLEEADAEARQTFGAI